MSGTEETTLYRYLKVSDYNQSRGRCNSGSSCGWHALKALAPKVLLKGQARIGNNETPILLMSSHGTGLEFCQTNVELGHLAMQPLWKSGSAGCSPSDVLGAIQETVQDSRNYAIVPSLRSGR